MVAEDSVSAPVPAQGTDSPKVRPSASFWLLVFCLSCYWAVLIQQLGAQWSVYEQYNYGWAVPFLALYLLWKRLNEHRPLASSSFLCSSSVRSDSTLLWLLLFSCALLYAPTRFFHEANPIWRLASLLLALEVLGLTLFSLAMLHLQRPRPVHRVFGLTLFFRLFIGSIRPFLFPGCFFLTAVPWPSGLETGLTQWFMRISTSITVEVLGFIGLPAAQHGNVIEVGRGMVGIDEACSGIRSSQASLMLCLFFGELYRLSWWRRMGLLLSGLVLALVFNLLRTLLLTHIAASRGTAVMSKWHDPAGTVILAGCFLLLWVLAIWLRAEAIPTFRTQPHYAADFSVSERVVPWMAAVLLAWFILVETGIELWYRSHERATGASIHWSLGVGDNAGQFTKLEIPKEIRSQFKCDEGTELRWHDSAGNAWQMYYLRWFPARSLKSRVAIQLAKSHGPEICLPAAGMKLEASLGTVRPKVKGIELALQQFRFSFQGRLVHVFYGIYEDASGTALANRRTDFISRVRAALAGSRNYGQRFVEFSVLGPESSASAVAALQTQLGLLLDVHIILVETNSFQPLINTDRH